MSLRIARWLVLAALVLPLAMVLAPVQAQPGRPGGMGGMPGQPGMRGGMPNGMGGAPGGNFQGGNFQGGMPGQPQGIAGGINGGINGGMGGINGGGLQDEWVCSRCGSVIGHGPVKPGLESLPSCGAKLVDDPGGMDNGPPANSPPPTMGNSPAPSKSSSSSDSGSSNSGKTVLIAVGIGVGVLVLFGAVGAIVYFNISRNSKRSGSAPPQARYP